MKNAASVVLGNERKCGDPGRDLHPLGRLHFGLSKALFFALLVAVSVAHAAEPDTSSSRHSDDGSFVVSIRERPEPVPLNVLHAWTLHVETADGETVDDADIEVDGGMPMHDHGLPTAPRVTAALGDGDYLLEGMKFQMPGHWVINLSIASGGASDTVTFELML